LELIETAVGRLTATPSVSNRQSKTVTQADRCTLVFDTDSKSLYVEREVAHLDAKVGGTLDYQTVTMDVADYLKRGGHTAGHRKRWRLPRMLFKQDSDPAQAI
jgi:hypothetical protein